MKKDFRDSGILRSGRYFLPEAPNLSSEGTKSGLLTKLALMSAIYPCGATHQRCHPVVPMLRFGSADIDDFLPMGNQYWDNSFLFVKNGYTVGIKCPTESEIEWFSTPSEDEKTIVESTLEDENNSLWNTITVPNPSNVISIVTFCWKVWGGSFLLHLSRLMS